MAREFVQHEFDVIDKGSHYVIKYGQTEYSEYRFGDSSYAHEVICFLNRVMLDKMEQMSQDFYLMHTRNHEEYKKCIEQADIKIANLKIKVNNLEQMVQDRDDEIKYLHREMNDLEDDIRHYKQQIDILEREAGV